MRILLVQPEWRQDDFGFRLAAMPEPLGLEMLAAVLPDHEVRIADLRCGDRLDEALAQFAPDIVGVTALTPEVYAAIDILRQVKARSSDIFTVVGGYHASLVPQGFFLPDVDAIVIGEGEDVLSELVGAVERGDRLDGIANLIYRDRDGKFIANELTPRQVDLEKLPLPRRDLTERHRQEYFFLFDRPDTSMATGRGCPFRCNFCSVWVFYHGQVRLMSPRRVLEELRAVRTEHITFVDDNFLLNRERESRIADMVRAEGISRRYSMECRTDAIVRHPELVTKWVDIGLYAVLLGLEGSDKTLVSVNKKITSRINDEAIHILQDHGVVIWGAFIVDPAWDEDDFKGLREYVHSRGITHTQFTVLTPLPGTELYRRHADELLTHDYRCYDTLHAVVPTRLPREQFYRNFAELYRQSDLSPYFEMIRTGKLTIEDVKRGKAMLDSMSRWETYAVNDPVLGRPGSTRPPDLPVGVDPTRTP